MVVPVSKVQVDHYPKVNHTLGALAGLTTFKITVIIQSLLHDHSEVKIRNQQHRPGALFSLSFIIEIENFPSRHVEQSFNLSLEFN